MDTKVVRFALGRNHHQSKQPMLVLFTDDGRRSASVEHIKSMTPRLIPSAICVVLLLNHRLKIQYVRNPI